MKSGKIRKTLYTNILLRMGHLRITYNRKNVLQQLSGFLITLFLISGCVSSRTFNEQSKRLNACEEEMTGVKDHNEQLNVSLNEMKYRMTSMQNQIEYMIQDSVQRSAELTALHERYTRLNSLYDELQQAQQSLLAGNQRETARLLKQLQDDQSAMQQKEDYLKNLEASLAGKQKSLQQLNSKLQERDARLSELESVLNKKDSAVNQLKSKVSNALPGFEGNGLAVHLKNGKVYVSMDEQLLFKSGSFDVDPRGKEALQKLGRVLEQNPDITVMIEGHTDDVPYHPGGVLVDNWDLSVKRATSVTRILLKNSSVDPARLIAAGRSEYLPVDTEKTPEARKKNRRIEIILTPKLDELFHVIEMN